MELAPLALLECKGCHRHVFPAVKKLAGQFERLRSGSSDASSDHLARDIRWEATWKAALVGAAAALPGHPLLSVLASVVEAELLDGIETRALSSLALLDGGTGFASLTLWRRHQEKRCQRILGTAADKAVSLFLDRAKDRAVRVAVKEVTGALPRLLGRAVFGAVAPAVGIVVSAACNAIEMHSRLTPAVRTVPNAPEAWPAQLSAAA